MRVFGRLALQVVALIVLAVSLPVELYRMARGREVDPEAVMFGAVGLGMILLVVLAIIAYAHLSVSWHE